MLCKKYQIIPKPNYKPKIFFNNDIINYLQKISSDKELPNLLLYGNNGCGKQSLVDLLLYYMYKNDTKIVSNTITIDIIGSNEEVEIKSSNNHMIFYSNGNNTEKYILQGVIKYFVSTINNICNDVKLIIINDLHKMTCMTQMSLRQTMEKYSNICRFVLVSNSISNIIEPLKSRCINKRIENPTDNQLMELSKYIMDNECDSYDIDDIKDIVSKSNNNVSKLLLMLEIYYNGCEIVDDYDNIITKIVKLLITKKMHNVENIKTQINNLLIINVPSDKLMFDIINKLIESINDIKKSYSIIQCGIKYNKLIHVNKRDIVILTSFIINLMCLI